MSSQIQDWDPTQYKTEAAFVAELGKPVLELLAPKPGDRVLDLGCGDGALTLEIVRAGCDVIGIDASEEMVKAAGAAGVEAYLGDGADLSFVEEFDAVFSNATLHWIKPADAVLRGVWRALRAGGRFVGEFGGMGNVSAIIGAIETALSNRGVIVAHPWFFPTVVEYTTLLEDAGFTVHTIDRFDRPTRLPGDIGGWLETFAQHYLSAVAECEREGLKSEIIEDLSERISDNKGNWYADYVRLRFHAEKSRFAA